MRQPMLARTAELLVRLLYLGGAVGALWLSKKAADIYGYHVNQVGTFSSGRWILVVGAGTLVGVMLGLAVRPWGMRGRYRWDVALALGALPAAWFALQFLMLTETVAPPRWFFVYVFEFGFRYQTLFAAMLGLAITSGLIARRPS